MLKSDLRNTLLACLTMLCYVYIWHGAEIYCDFQVYLQALEDMTQFGTPYIAEKSLPFVYLPAVIRLFQNVDRLIPLGLFLIASYLLVLIFTLHQLHSSQAIQSIPRHIAVGTAAAAMGGTGVMSLLGGNMTPYLHLLTIAMALFCLQKPHPASWLAFAVIVGLTAIVKPYLLAYALLLFVMASIRAALAGLLLATTIVGCSVSYSYLYEPILLNSFQDTLQLQVLARSDMGYGFYGLARSLLKNEQAALIVHGLCSISMLYLAMIYIPSRKGFRHDDLARLLFAVPALVLLNPRLKEYDLFPALYCLLLFIQRIDIKSQQIIWWSLLCSAIPIIGMALERLLGITLPLYRNLHVWEFLGVFLAYCLYLLGSSSPNKSFRQAG